MAQMKLANYHLESWFKFFKEYTTEPVNNIYVKNFDLDFAFKSLLNTFVSDFLVYQILSYESLTKTNLKNNFKFYIPKKVIIEGENHLENQKYEPLYCFCETLKYNNLLSDLNNSIKNQIDNNQNDIHETIYFIQNKILNKNYLFEEFYQLKDNPLTLSNPVKETFIAYNDPEKKQSSGEITYKFEFLDNDKDKTPEDIIFSLFSIAVFTLRNKKRVDFRELQAKRNAIAKVMSKNLSHTDGSHVMVDFERYMSKKLEEISNGDIKNTKIQKELKIYNQHLRNTMELVADISGRMGMQSNYEENLLTFIDLLQTQYFSKQTEGIIESHFLGRGLNDGEEESVLEFVSKKNLNKNVLFPGAINGKTAFISILKNVFRNLKKYSEPEVNKDCIKFYSLEIDLSDAFDDEIKSEYYKITLTEKSKHYPKKDLDRRINDINKHLYKDPLIDEEGKIKNEGWGLLEVRILAAYLIGLPLDIYKYDEDKVIFEHQGRKFPMKFVFADMYEENCHFYLRHNFYLRKSTFATTWLDESDEKKTQIEKIGNLKDFGINIKQKDDEVNYKSPVKFVIKNNYTIDKCRKYYNFRYIPWNQIECEIELTDKPEDLKDKIISTWINGHNFEIKKIDYFDNNITSFYMYLKKDDNSQKALLDNHSKYFNKLLKENDNDSEKVINLIKKDYSYYETSSSVNEARKAFNDAKQTKEYHLILETLNTNVYIWDERIQIFLNNSTQENVVMNIIKKDIYKLKGIYIPEIDLKEYFSKNKEEEANKEWQGFIDNIKCSFDKADYVILHFSGFENIVKRNNLTIEKAYNELLDKINIKSKSKYIIFTSGKGIPVTLPDKCFFIPWTTLEDLIKNRPKLELIKALNAIRIIETKTN